MASGRAGVLMPGRVAVTLELPAGTERGIAETRAGLGGTHAGLGEWAYLAAEIGLGALALAGARRARGRL